MKISTLLLFFVIFSVSATSYSQEVKVTLNLQNVSINEVFSNIQKQTNYSFWYDLKDINLDRIVSVKAENKTVSSILEQILKEENATFKMVDNHIVIIPKQSIDNKQRISQQKKVTGTIKDHQNEPIIGANIIEKNTQNGTITDENGYFSLDINPNSTLVVTYIGYLPKEIPVGSKDIFNIILTEDVEQLEEVVVVGYGSVKKKDLTGSVVRINTDKYKDQAKTQVSDFLLGTVAGFYAQQSGSASDGASKLEVRGPTSLKASTSPLIVLDGVIYNGNLNDINPNDIEAVDILKDASSAAVYGSRAAAGVMIITTKKGVKGKPMINFSAQIGIAQPSNKKFRSYKGEDFLRFRRDAMTAWFPNDYPYYYYNPEELPTDTSLEEWRNASANPNADNRSEWGSRLNLFPTEHENFMAGNTIDMPSMSLQNGLRQSYDVSISGGTENTNYYWSLGYDNNETILKDGGFSALRTRLNVDFKIASWLTVGINTQFASRDESPIAISYSERVSPYCSIYKEDGSLNWYPSGYVGLINPLLSKEQERSKKANTLFSSIFAKVDLPFGFKYEMNFQPRYEYSKDYNFWGTDTFNGTIAHSQGYGSRAEYSQFEWMLDNIIRWNKQFGVHSFDLTLLYSAEKFRDWNSSMTGETFAPNANLGWHALQQAQKISINNNDTELTGNAAMARINYILHGKYLLTASVRRDGYSAFGQKNPYAVFPAVALAWRVSDEEFFKVPFISALKVRASWGVNGNRSIGQYSALATVSSSLYYDGQNSISNVYNASLANPDLKWERTESLNFGVDMALLKNRISIVADFYTMTTSDLLMDRRLPELTGFSNITTNLGELGNKGFELTLNTVNIDNKNFSWSSNLVFSLNRNKIKKLFGDYGEYILMGQKLNGELPDYNNGLFPGQPIDRVWGYNVIGVWQTEEADEAAKYNLSPGDYKSEDLDNNGKYEDKMDKQFIGYTSPRFRLGFGNDFTFLKHFTASIFLRADLGHIARASLAERDGGYEYNRVNAYDFPYWTPENRNQEWGGLRMSPSSYGGGLQIYKPASFLRIQDVSVGYNLPDKIAQKLHVNNARFSFSIRNLWCITDWMGWDPESLNTPLPRTYTFGVNISL
ncbi:TonB-dependent receptor [Parabacteroides bouchesdurhonensis]|uniref:TonB-dependent receptor n=1 Tax=Parabacteroides bouchesdurhonensis TaxID=1936995 RepID=UPI00131C77AE|nr:TonB-dependent receptor [Parabacteroides bouchesdurhonensis]